MTNKSEWEGAVGKGWAREWQRTDRSFAELTHVLVDHVLARGAAHSILDIGCGAGELSLAIAQAKPGSRILGIDVSPDLVAAAELRTPADARVSFRVADAAHWSDTHFRPDLLISRHGVMFFDDPAAAFGQLARAADPAARLVFSCFRDRSENPWAMEIAHLLPAPPPFDPLSPGPFAFADKDRVTGLLAEGGWRVIRHIPVDFGYVAGAGADPVADALDFFATIGPAAPVIRALDGAERTQFLDRLRALAQSHLKDNAVRFDAAAWIVIADRVR